MFGRSLESMFANGQSPDPCGIVARHLAQLNNISRDFALNLLLFRDCGVAAHRTLLNPLALHNCGGDDELLPTSGSSGCCEHADGPACPPVSSSHGAGQDPIMDKLRMIYPVPVVRRQMRPRSGCGVIEQCHHGAATMDAHENGR
jgi:hypothetical protein